jgi:DNA polymerase
MAEAISIDTAALARLTNQTRNLLAFHLEIGMPGYPATAALRNFLKKDQPVIKSPPAGKQGPVRRPAAPARQSGKSALRQLETLAGELAGCRSCGSLSGPAVAGQGSAGAKLFVIGDCCRAAGDDSAVVWSAEEDELFWKMMAAIGLDRESVYLTNCIKCGRREPCAEDVVSARNCFPFLERELAAIQPAMICTMGELAAGLLLGSRTPLVRIRGRFHQYRYPHGGIARVMPTFHPAFLLRHPEMKRAAWMDLQALQRQLNGL